MARIKWRRVFRRGTLAHPAKGVKYMVANSLRGMRWAKRLGKKSADRDLRFTKDGVCVVVHWSLLYKEGIPVPHNYRVEDHTWAEVSKLRGPGGTAIHTLTEDLKLLASLKMYPILEPKSNDPRFHNPDWWAGIVILNRKLGGRTLRGYALRANAKAVPAMRGAGIRAHVLSK